jgi:clusterin-associated protein 1
MENFRKPNFELVADILYWMVKLYDQDTSISDRVEFEDERVEFLTGIASLMATKARLKLNTKKLYASDGRAVQEMLKFASLLYKANKYSKGPINDDTTPPPIKIQEVKGARTLASEITQSGAKLSDYLQHEVTDKVERAKALRFLDSAGSSSEGSREHMFIERSIKELIDRTRTMVEDMKKESDELTADERNIESKIRKKQEELERTEKRMKSLENVRPQFMEEVEKLEKELQRHYDVYIEKVRNLDYLEHELEKYHKAEEERKEEHDRKMKKMRERLRKEEVDLLRGEIAETGFGGGSKARSPGQAESKFGGGDGTFSRKPQAKYEEEDSDDDEEFPDDDDISDDDSDLDTESGSDEHF